MADPITTINATDRISDSLPAINDNFSRRQWLDVRTVTSATYAVALTDECILVDPTSNAVELDLPPVAAADGMQLVVIALNVTNTVTLDGDAAETINGSATKTLGSAGDRVTLVASPTGWRANVSAAL